MATFKVVCRIQEEGKFKEHPLFIKNQKDSNEAEKTAKYYFLEENSKLKQQILDNLLTHPL